MSTELRKNDIDALHFIINRINELNNQNIEGLELLKKELKAYEVSTSMRRSLTIDVDLRIAFMEKMIYESTRFLATLPVIDPKQP